MLARAEAVAPPSFAQTTHLPEVPLDEVPAVAAPSWTDHLVISGYVQAQYAMSQLSQDELQQGGDACKACHQDFRG